MTFLPRNQIDRVLATSVAWIEGPVIFFLRRGLVVWTEKRAASQAIALCKVFPYRNLFRIRVYPSRHFVACVS